MSAAVKSGGFDISASKCLVVALLLVEPLFKGVVPASLSRGCFALGALLVAWYFLRHADFDLSSVGFGAFWAVLGLVAIASRLMAGGDLNFQVLSLLAACGLVYLASCSTDWFDSALVTLLALLGIHMAATVLFYFAPALHAAYIAPLYDYDRNAVGYQSGLTSHYSTNGMFMASGCVLAFSLMLHEGRGARRRWLGLAAALFMFALLLTTKRAVLGFGVVGLLFAYATVDSRGKFLKVVCAVAAAGAAFAVLATVVPGVGESLERFASTFESGSVEESANGRVALWEYAVQGWLQSPLLGNGWGTYRYTWPGGNYSIYAHNELLQLLHDVGILGAALALALILGTLVATWRASQNEVGGGSVSRALTFSFGFQVFNLLYAFTTGGLLQSEQYFFGYFLAAAILFAARASRRQRASSRRLSSSRPTARLVADA